MTIQKPLDCRIAHCGASCNRITVEQMEYLYKDVTKCPYYERRDDLYMNDLTGEVLDKIRAEIVEMRSKQNVGVLECLDIIDKYRNEVNE